MMSSLLAVAMGGAMGASLRWATYQWVTERYPDHSWLATVTVNVVGSFLAGIMLVLLTERLALSDEWRLLLLTGLLGALTTFSMFSLDIVHLLNSGQLATAVAYLIGSVLLCVAAAWLGMAIMRCY